MPYLAENISLQALNTFRVPAYARWFTTINTENELHELYRDEHFQKDPLLILGGGSNMLFTRNFQGLAVRMNIQGITCKEDGDDVFVTAGGGVVWHDLVMYCVNNEFAGIENLSLIPGSVGASPIQNIGAYGVELMEVFHSCRAFDIETGSIKEFDNAACSFSYRDSIFKHELKGRYIITEVTYKLSRTFKPQLSYGAISEELKSRGILNPSIKDVSDVVSAIRVSKLPDPATIGNAGSFFKNPVVGSDQFRDIQSIFPDIVHYVIGNDAVKLAAGWLIEQCGWKGKIVGNTGTWKNQALVLVNHGNATGKEIFELSADIINSVQKTFGVSLEREVNII
ncbi:UDP-N-acetylmuramate dehydrogenase [Flavihumibacter sp. R14]|nr:UDP-N-acetylmuramate dehydrogenase [Flavihumibacter soli]